MQRPTIGFMFRCQLPPEQLSETARRVEAAGFDELWVVEDCFFGGGIASLATALAVTHTLRIGLGIMPAVARNPAFTAMELATLARLYPQRILPGIGHGVTDWMRQIGALPASQLRALEETISAIRALLRGERVSVSGQTVKLEDVQLAHPPTHVPPLLAGAMGPRTLQLAGRVADGTILSEGTSPTYVSWARQQILLGATKEGRTAHHPIIAYMWCCVAPDTTTARDALRPHIATMVANGNISPQIAALGITKEIETRIKQSGKQSFIETFPDEWLDQLAIVGDPATCVKSIGKLAESGADTIVFAPLPDQSEQQFDALVRDVLPLLG